MKLCKYVLLEEGTVLDLTKAEGLSFNFSLDNQAGSIFIYLGMDFKEDKLTYHGKRVIKSKDDILDLEQDNWIFIYQKQEPKNRLFIYCNGEKKPEDPKKDLFKILAPTLTTTGEINEFKCVWTKEEDHG